MSTSIPSLTGLRFVAAASIVITHYTGGLGHMILGVPTQFSALGMPLFFTLSGFVIHYVYAASFQTEWSTAAVEFSVARIARLYPLFIFLFAYYMLFSGTLGPMLIEHPGIGFSFATMTASWWYWVIDGKSMMSLPYGVSWSVSTEVFFYILYALVLYRLASIRRPLVCTLILIGFCVFSYAALYLLFATQDRWEPYIVSLNPNFISIKKSLGDSFWQWFVYVSPFLHTLEFIGGCLTCQLSILIRRNSVKISRRMNDLLCWAGLIWIAIAMSSLYVAWYAPPTSHRDLFNFVNFLHHTFLLAPGCCLVILALALGDCWLAKPLSSSTPVFLGEISYSLYLIHPLVIGWVYMTTGFPYPLLGLMIALLITVAVAAGMYQVIEKPSKAWIKAAFRAISSQPIRATAIS